MGKRHILKEIKSNLHKFKGFCSKRGGGGRSHPLFYIYLKGGGRGRKKFRRFLDTHPIFVQNVSILPNIFWYPPLFFISVHKEIFYFIFKLLKLLKNCLFNGQWVCLGLLCVITSEKMDNLMVRKGNKWHRKKYFLTRKKSKSHTFDTHHPHHMFLGFFPDPPVKGINFRWHKFPQD